TNKGVGIASYYLFNAFGTTVAQGNSKGITCLTRLHQHRNGFNHHIAFAYLHQVALFQSHFLGVNLRYGNVVIPTNFADRVGQLMKPWIIPVTPITDTYFGIKYKVI